MRPSSKPLFLKGKFIMKTRLFVAALVSLSFVVGSALAADKELTGSCPISGKPISKEHSIAFKGKEVYFCCPNCDTAFNANTEKYAAKAHHQLLQTGQIIQVACPLTGREINKATLSQVAEAKVSFCCNNCKGKFDKAEDKVALVFASIDKGFTLQTACPISNKKIDVTKVVEHDGKKVYFCCPNCDKAFTANPEKFVAKLPQFKKES